MTFILMRLSVRGHSQLTWHHMARTQAKAKTEDSDIRVWMYKRDLKVRGQASKGGSHRGKKPQTYIWNLLKCLTNPWTVLDEGYYIYPSTTNSWKSRTEWSLAVSMVWETVLGVSPEKLTASHT